MVYINIEYLSKDGKWRAFSTMGFISGKLLMGAVSAMLETLNSSLVTWRLRVRN